MMNFDFISSDLTIAIVYTLLHSVWQIGILALLFKWLLSRTQFQKSQLKAQIGVAILGILGVCSMLTFSYYIGKSMRWMDMSANSIASLTDESVGISGIASTIILEPSLNLISNFHQHIVITWLTGVLLFGTRIGIGFIGLNRIRQSLNYNIPAPIQSTFSNIKAALKGPKNLVIASSNKIDIPMVMGHFKPIVVLPLAAINQLTTEEVEVIIAHEIAHVLRSDFIQNFLVVLVESIFFFHPLVWWITSIIRKEREHSCDDITIQCFPNRLNYAKTLLKLESFSHQPNGALSIALFTKKQHLMNRVNRILNQTSDTSSRWSSSSLLGIGILFLGLLVGVSWIKSDANMKSEDTEISSDSSIADFKSLIENETPVFESFAFLADRDTIIPDDGSSKREVRRKMRELREELRETQEEASEQMQQLKKEHQEKLKEKQRELKRLSKEIDGDEYSEEDDEDFYMSRRDRRELEESLNEWAEDMEAWQEEHGDELEEELTILSEELGEEMEAFGEEIAAHFDEEWQDDMRRMGDRFAEKFDDKWVAKMERSGKRFGKKFDKNWGERFAEKFENEEMWEGLADMSATIAEIGVEISEEVIRAMEDIDVENLNYNISMGDAEDSDDLKLALGRQMSKDVSLKMGKNKLEITEDELKINGKSQSKDLYKKYKDIILRMHDTAFTKGKTTIKFHFYGKDVRESDKTSLSIHLEE